MPILLLLFILVPIVEIGVFIAVGDLIGLGATLLTVFVTAVVGVNLLKQQGLHAWSDIQSSIAQGRVPAVEMASAAQLLFAGGLLLTPGFVTDTIGFLLMIPAIRRLIARRLMQHWSVNFSSVSGQSYSNSHYTQSQRKSTDAFHHPDSSRTSPGRTIEGEFEDPDEKSC